MRTTPPCVFVSVRVIPFTARLNAGRTAFQTTSVPFEDEDASCFAEELLDEATELLDFASELLDGATDELDFTEELEGATELLDFA